MTSCSSTPTDPATAACTVLADAQNATHQADYRIAHGAVVSEGSDAIIRRGPRATDALALALAPASLAAVFSQAAVDANLAATVRSATAANYHLMLDAETSIDAALQACVKAGVPVQTVDSNTGQTSQMSG